MSRGFLSPQYESIGLYIVKITVYGFPHFDAKVSIPRKRRKFERKRTKRQRAWDRMVKRLRAMHPSKGG